MKKKIDHIKHLKPDSANARKHNPRNIGMIVDSLQEVGASRSIVIDEDDNILAGNGTIEAAAEAGITRLKVVEADGNEIIAVRRRGLNAFWRKPEKIELGYPMSEPNYFIHTDPFKKSFVLTNLPLRERQSCCRETYSFPPIEPRSLPPIRSRNSGRRHFPKSQMAKVR